MSSRACQSPGWNCWSGFFFGPGVLHVSDDEGLTPSNPSLQDHCSCSVECRDGLLEISTELPTTFRTVHAVIETGLGLK